MVLIITTFSSFKVPTGSMESSILPGDYILVNKWLTGARIFDVWESVEGKEVEIHRLPGIRKFKRNDVVVFNDPYFRSADSISMDIKRYYVKRCVALPGDTFEIRRGVNRAEALKMYWETLNANGYFPMYSCLPKDGGKKASFRKTA